MNNILPKISIIVPVYNVERYIVRTMDSLLEQTLQEIEIILVDDESPDKCPQICDGYASAYSNVKVVHKKNGGLGMARNSGLDVATGEYVMFVDSDDTIAPNSCEIFYRRAKEYDADVVTGNFNTENSLGIWHKTPQPEGLQVLRGDDIRKYMLDMVATAPYKKEERLYPVSVCISCIRRRLIEDNKLRFMSEREISSEDTIFKVRLLKHTKILVREPLAFYNYFLNGTSLTHSFCIDKYNNLGSLYKVLSNELKDDEDAKLRIDRFIISDARMHFLRLAQSENRKKVKTIRQMVDSEIWDKVKEYKPSYYPLYQRLFYVCIQRKSPLVLFLYLKLIVLLKKVLKR